MDQFHYFQQITNSQDYMTTRNIIQQEISVTRQQESHPRLIVDFYQRVPVTNSTQMIQGNTLIPYPDFSEHKGTEIQASHTAQASHSAQASHTAHS